MSPSFSGAAETLSDAYKASGNPQFVKTGDKGTEIDFVVTGIKNPKLVSATYVSTPIMNPLHPSKYRCSFLARSNTLCRIYLDVIWSPYW